MMQIVNPFRWFYMVPSYTTQRVCRIPKMLPPKKNFQEKMSF